MFFLCTFGRYSNEGAFDTWQEISSVTEPANDPKITITIQDEESRTFRGHGCSGHKERISIDQNIVIRKCYGPFFDSCCQNFSEMIGSDPQYV